MCYNVNMNQNIVKINYNDKEIYLIKTAHVSKNSVGDVTDCFNEINPDSICIELDKQRYESINNKDKWRDTDISSVIKENKVGLLLVNIILSSFQKRMATSLDSQNGGEMMEGIKLANENNKNLVLADRSVNTTFSRVWNSLSLIEKSKLLVSIISSIFDKEEISEEELQELKESDALEAALNEVSKDFPNLKKALVDERDQYLSSKIKNAPGKKVMAIIGAAHAKGIENNINKDIDTDELETVKKKKGLGTIIKWIIPLAILAMLVYTVYVNKDTGINQIKSWVLWNGTSAALAAIICTGHPLTILTAFIAAPITSLNPILSSGLFAALVEATIRKPKVKDFEDISDDTSSIKGFFKNRVTRILLIFILVNLFSSIATFISGAGILTAFINLFN